MTSGFDALEAPDKLPTVFNGDKAVIYGIFRSKAASDAPLDAGVSGTATLKGKILGVSFEHTIPFNVPSPSESPDDDSFKMPIVHHLAAKSLIRDWEHKEGWASAVSESECKKEIIRVSIESSVVSSHTAYIAVDEDQDKPIEGAIQTWDVTATMAAEERLSMAKNILYASARSMKKGMAPKSRSGGPPMSRMMKSKKKESPSQTFISSGPPPPPLARSAAPPPQRMLYQSDMLSDCLSADTSAFTYKEESARQAPSTELTRLISLQQADGFWKLDSVTNFTSKSLSNPISGVDPNVWATVLALVLLESRFSEQEDEWELVAMKAETWLSMQTLPAGVDVAILKQEAKKLL